MTMARAEVSRIEIGSKSSAGLYGAVPLADGMSTWVPTLPSRMV